MGVYIDPPGQLIPNPGRFDLSRGAKVYLGNPKSSNTFIFTQVLGHDKVVIGGGRFPNVFNAAATPEEEQARYYNQLEAGFAAQIGVPVEFEGPVGTPKLSICHIGGKMHSKIEGGITVLHGGRYESPARVWISNRSTERIVIDGIVGVEAFQVDDIRPARSGHTGHLETVTLSARSTNRITNGQRVQVISRDRGVDPGWRPVTITFRGPSGPTEAEVARFVSNWSLIV